MVIDAKKMIMQHITNNNLRMCILAILLMTGAGACKKMDGYIGPVSDDMTKPPVVTNVKVANFKGGAYLTYDLPKSANLLYVLAKYRIRDNVSRQTKSSYYSDSITVNGFAESKEYTVTLFSVSRANVFSDSVTVTVHPDTPYYKLIKPSVVIHPDFGGINVTATNPDKQPLGYVLVTYDNSTQSYEVQDQHYSNVDSLSYSVRGYDSIPEKFGVYVTDQWGNISDTVFSTVKPFYEALLDKSKFYKYSLNSDNPIGYGWDLPYLWDGNSDGGSTGWHTLPGGPLPILCSFGLGQTARISRFVLWQRTGQYTYSHGNPRDFTIWGSVKPAPVDAAMPLNSAPGTIVGDWVNLGNFHFPDPPSGLPPGATNAADEAFVSAGISFPVDIGNPAVQFIRLGISSTWSGGDFAHIIEMSFYGKPQ